MATYGRPDYSRSGPRRDALSAPAKRALVADRSLSSDSSDAVNVTGPLAGSLDGLFVATVDNDKIVPVSIDEFDTRFGGGSGGGLSASAAMTRCLGC